MQWSDTSSVALIIGVAMSAVHVFSPNLVFLDRTPRSIWLSLAGGVSVSYVFVHLLPELGHLKSNALADGEGLEMLYLFALVGFVIYYSLEMVAVRHGGERKGSTPPAIFWLHLASFALYNFVVGELLEEQARLEGLLGAAQYAVAMGLHFLVNDRSLYAHHGALYLNTGRWVLAGAVIGGAVVGAMTGIPAWLTGIAIALLAGGVIFNVIKEELPEERESRVWAFVLGACIYTVLVLV